MSDQERSRAERIRADAWRLVQETDSRTRNRQTDTTKRLGDRSSDIAFWKSELNNEIDSMQSEIANLQVKSDDDREEQTEREGEQVPRRYIRCDYTNTVPLIMI